jgi:hypothetical protein
VGSQQRSDKNFHHAVSNGKGRKQLGNLTGFTLMQVISPPPITFPKSRLPADLNWDMWLGPNPYVHYNHEA